MELHPDKYAYKNLKTNAKRRGKEFSLTFEEFIEFAIKHNYIAGKGITKTGLHIDRIDNRKGYTIDNIQVLTNSENIRKYMTYDIGLKGKPVNFKINKSIINNKKEEGDPF